MKIGEAEVRHVARLAELAVAEADLPLLATQLEGIVTFVEQLSEVTLPPESSAVAVGPERLTLREDVVNPIPMAHGPEAIAPVFIDGFFVVPKLGGMAEE
ncbi:MAG: Asp-tRNA(Asn)/Glu-tRNA(Gln) amidotransferase subunit GatC [Gemmatimonadales bacterium]|jgi:aspartyl-tRNA(Asn)/glutamyl-tRNA(Gln) amidotransferase subunit C|nr:Asp-tRNA(Asn)/Glu-tRNA(Gln) amidotransferase subunit GatC [Gemmatimonadales bacterium]